MKKPSQLLAIVLSSVLGAALLGTPTYAQQRPRALPLLGVGQEVPAPVPTAVPDPADPFFDDTVLQEIRLTINSKDWNILKENYLLNDYYPCDFTWRGQTVRNVGIRSRGNGSRSGTKPGLRVDFDRYNKGQQFLGLKSFVLRNNTQDPSNLHERVGMLLYKRMGAVASRETHAKLYVNNEFAGVYTIVESVDKTFLKKQLGEDEGYLFKYDYPATELPYYFEDRGSDPASYVPLPFKAETNETNPRPEYIVQFVQTVNQASAASFQSAVGAFVDLDKFIRHIAIEAFIGDLDGFTGDWGMNNFYMYRFLDQTKFLMLPWDKSEAFKVGADFNIFHNLNDNPESQRNRFVTRVLQFPDLYNLYLDTLLAVADAASLTEGEDLRGWLEKEVDREYFQIADAVRADTQKPYTNEVFEEQVNAMREFARNRATGVRQQVAAARR